MSDLREPFRYRPQNSDPPVDPTRCRASVFADYSSHQCGRPAKYGEWCGTHEPARAASRAAKRGPTRFERECAARTKRAERVDAMKAALRFYACEANYAATVVTDNDSGAPAVMRDGGAMARAALDDSDHE